MSGRARSGAALLGLSLGLGCTPWDEAPKASSPALAVVGPESDPASADRVPGVYPPSPPQELLITRSGADGSIVAEWWGEPARYEPHESPFPLEYSVEELWFRFPGDGGVERFSPAGTLHFSDWQTNIFSPDGARIVLAQGRFGPYHALRREHLRAYLRGERPADLEIGWEASSSESFVPVHGPVRWLGPRTIDVLYDSETPQRRSYALP